MKAWIPEPARTTEKGRRLLGLLLEDDFPEKELKEPGRYEALLVVKVEELVRKQNQGEWKAPQMIEEYAGVEIEGEDEVDQVQSWDFQTNDLGKLVRPVENWLRDPSPENALELKQIAGSEDDPEPDPEEMKPESQVKELEYLNLEEFLGLLQ